MPQLPDDPFGQDAMPTVPDACTAIGMAVLDIIAHDPDLAAVLVIEGADGYTCYGVRPKGLQSFMLDDDES